MSTGAEAHTAVTTPWCSPLPESAPAARQFSHLINMFSVTPRPPNLHPSPPGLPARPPSGGISGQVWRRSWILFLLGGLLVFFLSGVPVQARIPSQTEPAYQIFLPITTTTPLHPALPPPGDWLGYVNFYRTTAGLPLLQENPAWSDGGWLHARYIVKNNQVNHFENPNNPWYTPEGHAAAQASNLFGSFNPNETIEKTIEGWMQGPFHAVGILDPHLSKTGYGIYHEPDGAIVAGAALDIIRGLGPLPPTITFPIRWPGPGSRVPLTQHTGEYPNPLSSCPGYQSPSGLPILLFVGPGDLTPHVTNHSFSSSNTALDHCVFNEFYLLEPRRRRPGPGSGFAGFQRRHRINSPEPIDTRKSIYRLDHC